MKTGRSPGQDRVTTEMLKLAKSRILPQLTAILNQCLRNGEVPAEMADSRTILLFKKGDHLDLKNYRPISLLDHLQAGRLQEELLNSRTLMFLPDSNEKIWGPTRAEVEQMDREEEEMKAKEKKEREEQAIAVREARRLALTARKNIADESQILGIADKIFLCSYNVPKILGEYRERVTKERDTIPFRLMHKRKITLEYWRKLGSGQPMKFARKDKKIVERAQKLIGRFKENEEKHKEVNEKRNVLLAQIMALNPVSDFRLL
ncbi:hypothetical protein L596_006344 [Steinernema carpocapsae]|uniref:Uncharacterized protein n=1 Tax=Steinernema carpocapsae TaxID=34508 RepID=A0A4U8V891_STECR|nr:hypothetical protein L596_006344 [Steinernema carpocapsae]